MEKQQNNQSAAIAIVILLLTAVTLVACFGLIYAYGKIALLKAELAEKDEEIAQIHAEHDAEKQAMKNLFIDLDNYVDVLEYRNSLFSDYINSPPPSTKSISSTSALDELLAKGAHPIMITANTPPDKTALIEEMHKILGDDREYDCESIKDFYLQYFG